MNHAPCSNLAGGHRTVGGPAGGPARGSVRGPARGGTRAFTLLELLMSILIIAISAAIVLPTIGDGERAKLIAGASVLQSDIELVQSLAFAQPDDPPILRIDVATGRWWIADADAPNTPIAVGDDIDPYEVTLGLGRAAAVDRIRLQLDDPTDATIVFNPQGGLADFDATPVIRLAGANSAIELEISPSTGLVRQRFVGEEQDYQGLGGGIQEVTPAPEEDEGRRR